jgi:Anti-sigma-K factor rskA
MTDLPSEDRMGEVGRLIASAPLEHEPPADLEERVFALVAMDDAARLIASAPLEAEPPLDLERRSLLGAGVAGSDRRSRVAAVVAPGLAAAAVTLAVLGANWHSDAEHWHERASTAATQLGSLGTPMGNILLSGPSTSHSPARGELVRLDQGYRLVLDTSTLPPTPPGYSYELWLAGPSGRTPAGSFSKTGSEHAMLAFMIGVDPAQYPKLEVRLEPNDGRPTLSGEKVMQARIVAQQTGD